MFVRESIMPLSMDATLFSSCFYVKLLFRPQYLVYFTEATTKDKATNSSRSSYLSFPPLVVCVGRRPALSSLSPPHFERRARLRCKKPPLIGIYPSQPSIPTIYRHHDQSTITDQPVTNQRQSSFNHFCASFPKHHPVSRPQRRPISARRTSVQLRPTSATVDSIRSLAGIAVYTKSKSVVPCSLYL